MHQVSHNVTTRRAALRKIIEFLTVNGTDRCVCARACMCACVCERERVRSLAIVYQSNDELSSQHHSQQAQNRNSPAHTLKKNQIFLLKYFYSHSPCLRHGGHGSGAGQGHVSCRVEAPSCAHRQGRGVLGHHHAGIDRQILENRRKHGRAFRHASLDRCGVWNSKY